MPIPELVLSPDVVENLHNQSQGVENPPAWFLEPQALLTFEIVVQKLPEDTGEKEVYKIHIGNSGLGLYYDRNLKFLEMYFFPNGSSSAFPGQEIVNVGIWAAGFKHFVDWYFEQHQYDFPNTTIKGDTHFDMFEVRRKLLWSLEPKSIKELDGGPGWVKFKIDLLKAREALTNASPDSLYSKVVERITSHQKQILMSNPRLGTNEDPDIGQVTYDLWENL